MQWRCVVVVVVAAGFVALCCGLALACWRGFQGLGLALVVALTVLLFCIGIGVGIGIGIGIGIVALGWISDSDNEVERKESGWRGTGMTRKTEGTTLFPSKPKKK